VLQNAVLLILLYKHRLSVYNIKILMDVINTNLTVLSLCSSMHSPVHSARKFSHVLGQTSEKSSNTTRPTRTEHV